MKYRLGELVECSTDNNKWERAIYLCYEKYSRFYYAMCPCKDGTGIKYFSYCRKIKE